ncbi:hypothetical protein BH10PSE17_BH10PSE17_34390 [soil metagenome]
MADRRVLALGAAGWIAATVAAVSSLAARIALEGWTVVSTSAVVIVALALLHALRSMTHYAMRPVHVEVDAQGHARIDGVEARIEQLDAQALARRVMPARLAAPLGRYRRWSRQRDGAAPS